MKLFSIILLSFILISCSLISNSEEEKNIDLDILSKQLFKDYQYSYNTNRQKSSTQLVVVTIAKKNFNNNDYLKIRNKLFKLGWDEVDNYDNYYNFCKNSNYSIDILNPVNTNHYTRNGDKVNFDSMDYWYFAMYYNKLGINNCMDFYKNK